MWMFSYITKPPWLSMTHEYNDQMLHSHMSSMPPGGFSFTLALIVYGDVK
jgi:hypothetical protein